MKLSISVVQLNAKIKQVGENIATVNRLIAGKALGSLVVLPELSFTGYAFESKSEIAPFLEEADTGPSIQWAQEAANTTGSHFIVGYPELLEGRVFNTAALVSPSTSILAKYRKTHLYAQDKVFGCSPGPGFQCFGPFEGLPFRLQIGICMDLNPHEFTAPWHAFEFASSLRDNKAQLAIVPCTWAATDMAAAAAGATDKQLVDYWMDRQPYQIPTVLANKCGVERMSRYGGSSTIMWPTQAGRATKSLDAHNEGVLTDTIDIF